MLTQGDDIQVFSGVMDSDTQERFIAKGNYRYLLNGENGINENNFGAIEDTLGNLEVINPYLRSGTNRCIGYFEDIQGSSVIYAVYNSGGYHGWYRWYPYRAPYTNGVIEVIYQVASPSSYDKFNPNPLNFQEDHLITGVNLVGNDLYWTDGYNQPKCMDIVRANETGKRRKFDVFFNSDSFTLPTNYTLNLYDERTGSLVLGLAWTASGTTYASRVQEFIAALVNTLSYQFFTVEDNTHYATITMGNVGRYYFDLQDNGSRISYVSPNNFYPDIVPGLPFNYAALSEFHTNSIKAPPQFIRAEYEMDYSVLPPILLRTHMEAVTLVGSAPNASPLGRYGVGFDNDSTGGYFDTDNAFTLGGWTGGTSAAPAVAAVLDTTGYNHSFITKLYVRLKVNSLTSSTIITDQFIAFSNPVIGGVLASDIFGYRFTIPEEAINNAAGGIIEFTSTKQVYAGATATIPTNLQPVMHVYGYTAWDIEIIDGYWETLPLDALTTNEIAVSSSWLFAAIYNYRNNKTTVMSSYSNVPKPVRYDENSIKITYNDFINDSVENFSELKSISLCYSNDGGTTWFNFNTINDYEFAGIKEKAYHFTNKESPIALSTAEAALLSHNVPVIAKSQEYADTRTWYGGMRDGYYNDTLSMELSVEYKALSDTSIYPNLHIWNEVFTLYGFNFYPDSYLAKYSGNGKYGLFWKRGWEGKIGVVYYDDYNRRYPVMVSEGSNLRIPFYTEELPDGTVSDKVPIVGWSIHSTPPKYATKYRFARTKNKLQGVFTNFTNGSFAPTYVDINDAPVTRTTSAALFCKIDLANIARFNNLIGGGQVPVQVAEGDIVRFIGDPTGTNFYPYKEFVIRKVITGFIYIDNDPNFPAITSASKFEMHIINTSSVDDVFYEFGDMYTIAETVQNGVLVKTHTGEIQDQVIGSSPKNIMTPATGKFGYGKGNVWYRDYLFITNIFGVSNYRVSEYFNDYETFVNIGDGRPNVYIDPSTKSFNVEDDLIIRDSTVRFSDPIVENTQINGLSAFQPLNEKQYDTTYGLVEKLQVVDNDVLKVIFGNSRMLSIYINQSKLQQAQGQTPLIIDADSVLGESHLVQRTLGTINPESVVINDEGDMMGFDQREGVAWRASGNGLVQTSDYLQKTTFKNFGLSRMKLDLTKSKCPAIYDLYRDLYILTLNSLSDVQQQLPEAEATLYDLDGSTPILSVNIVVLPNNTTIFSGSMVGTDLNSFVHARINAYGNGFSSVLNSDGTLTVTAPNIVGYGGSNLVVAVGYLDGFTIKAANYTFPFSAGQEPGTDPSFTGVTIAFSKQKNGWPQRYSFVPEMYGRLRNDIVSFKDGKLWAHNRGTVYKNFYGTQYPRELKLICNAGFPTVKQFIGVQVTGIGTNDVEVNIAPYQGIPSGMHSTVKAAHFEAKEGIQYAHLMRDDTTPGFRSRTEALLNGRPLVGQVCEVEFTNNDATKSVIYSAGVKHFHSEHS